jgi:Protein of unknown function (DUF3891)
MLLRADGDDAIAIGQPAHAWLSGQLARAWGNERFGAVEPYEEVCLAAEQHDAGMAAWERRPTLNPETGRPRSFMELTLDEHLEVWWSAAPLVQAQSRYAALLVSMHGTALYERRNLDRLEPAEQQRVRDFLAGQRELQERLREPGDRLVERNQRLVWTWDSLSLGLLLGWAPFTLTDVPTADADTPVEVSTTTLQPWPFRTPQVQLRCEGRRLTGRYDDEATMRAALTAAPWVKIEIELTRAVDD